jgi:hypothetical protein
VTTASSKTIVIAPVSHAARRQRAVSSVRSESLAESIMRELTISTVSEVSGAVGHAIVAPSGARSRAATMKRVPTVTVSGRTTMPSCTACPTVSGATDRPDCAGPCNASSSASTITGDDRRASRAPGRI